MDHKEKAVIHSCRTFLVDNLQNVSSILDDFIEAGIISSDEVDAIRQRGTRPAQLHAFLTELQHWRPDAFTVFLRSLERNHFKHIAAKLKKELESDGCKTHQYTSEEVPSWISPQVGRTLVTEDMLHLLAQELPPDKFLSLGSVLGYSHSRLQHFQGSHPGLLSLQMSTMFCDWKSTNGTRATVACLAAALNASSVREYLYRGILESFLSKQTTVTTNQKDTVSRPSSVAKRSEQWV